jgi:hypothetical protein
VRAAAPVLSWEGMSTDGSTFDYAWSLDKTVANAAAGTTPEVRLQKGGREQIKYKLVIGRTVNEATIKSLLTGTLVVTNVNAAPANASDPSGVVTVTGVTLTARATAGGFDSPLTVSCGVPSSIPPGGTLRCAFTRGAYNGGQRAATVYTSVAFTDASASPGVSPVTTPPSPEVSFDGVAGRYPTALLTDKAELGPIDSLYAGFTGFTRESVWRQDPVVVPVGGIQVTEPKTIEYTVSVGSFVVCTALEGVTITNTATLTPQDGSSNGAAVPRSASLRLVVWGCDRPPDVTFLDLRTWGATQFNWALTHRPTR